MDSLQRITFIPHLLAGQALLLFIIPALVNSDVIERWGNWFFLAGFGFLLGVIFPPGLFFVYAVLVVVTLVEIVSLTIKRTLHQSSWIFHHGISRLVFIFFSAPSLLYLSLMTSFYPWKRLAEYDIINPLPFRYIEYLQAMGPILPLGLLGLVLALLKKDMKLLGVVGWVLAWMSLLLIFHFVPQQSPLRFSEMVPHIPLGILTAYFFCEFFKKTKIKILRMIFLAIPFSTVIVGLGVMYSSWLWQKDFIDQKIIAQYPLVPYGGYVMYPLKDFIAAMKFLQDNTKRDTVILSGLTAGNYIPVYSGNTVYIGHANTVKAEEKQLLAGQFFSGKMSQVQAKEWFKISHIGAVYYGPQEAEGGPLVELSSLFPFLRKVYNNSFVSVYKPDFQL